MTSTPAEAPDSVSALLDVSPRQVPVTLGLIALNIVVFALMLLAGAGWWHTPNGVQLAWGANFGPATQDGQWWRLFSALFIHFGLIHLTLNMWALWDVGRLVEQLYGRWRFALLYGASGVVGNLLSLVLHGNDAVSGGASGSIFSLYGALLVFLWRERGQVEAGEFRWLFGAAALFSVLMLLVGFWLPGIDNAAHGGGLLAGALWGALLGRRWRPSSPAPAWGRRVAAALLMLGCAALIAELPAPNYRISEELRARAAIDRFLGQDQQVSQHWTALLARAQRKNLSFDELAGQIDKEVTPVYERSFEQLMAAKTTGAAPSAPTLGVLQNYATERAQASRELAQGLRAHDTVRIRRALEQARKARSAPREAQTPVPGASAATDTKNQKVPGR